MEITPQFPGVTGFIDTDTVKLICVGNRKYSCVDLCFKENMNIPFAKIQLNSNNLAMDADKVFDDAVLLGNEIARRWNSNND